MLKKKIYNFYLENVEQGLIIIVIEEIFKLKEKKISLYVHNLDFDGLLILSYITKTEKKYKYEAFTRESSFYTLEITEIESLNKIIFLCSYKIFPLSLKKIAQDFTIYKKLPFPYLFSKKENLFYIGKIPKVFY
jgi:hypothetical protein